MSPEVRPLLKRLIHWAAPLAALACGGDGGTDVVLPALRITTATSGVEVDADGYNFSIDGQAAQPISSNATFTLERLAEGQHSVELSGVAPNCAVDGENPRLVNTAGGSTATLAFVITCSPATGSVEVVTTTGGTGTDPDGFSLLIDEIDRGDIGPSATVSLSGLVPGPHTVGLTGFAANCQVAGENPRLVTVVAGETVQLAFAITCVVPGPTVGTLEITTSTSGTDRDPNGYQLSIDGGPSQPIGISGLVAVANLSATSHTVELLDVESNCALQGSNPITVAVPSGGTVQIGFVLICTAQAAGSILTSVTTSGSPTDPDGYAVSVDGGPPQAITVSGSHTFTKLVPGTHRVRLTGVAANCQVTGDNPVGVAVETGATASVSFAVTCAATLGGLAVTVTGLPAGAAAAVTVSGPNSFSQSVTETRSLTGLTPGEYAVSAQNVSVSGTTYTPSVGRPSVPVTAGATATVTVSYTPVVVAPTLNLRIDGLYLTQSSQTYGSTVPLVAGRDAYLRVFVVANEGNTARPRVRVQLSRSGAATETLNIEAPGASTPTQVQEGVLSSSWNLRISGSLIQTGLSIVAEVDQNTAIAETNEGDNRFPASGTKPLTVRTVPVARIRFISVQQGSSAPGVIPADEAQLLGLTRRIYPLNGIDTDVAPEVFTASSPLKSNGEGWFQLLSDLEGKRVDEGTDRTYFGVVKLDYGRADGDVGLTLGEGVPTSVGWDDASDASRVVAHELGHTWGRRHSPCNVPQNANIDGLYPYPSGNIGVFGFDVAATSLKPRSSPDIMGYCFQNPWISDYTYQGVMNFRQASAAIIAAGSPQPSVMIWGRIENGRPVLEPAFQIVTRPNLPRRPGRYAVIGTAADGSRLFGLSFDATTAPDDPRGNGHFAFAVPLDRSRASQLASVQLSGPGGVVARSRTMASLRLGETGTAAPITARREGQAVVLQWDASVHPTIMVRDPDTGTVLSFARGGNARVWTSKGELDLELSDGVKSQRLRLAINRS